ncbi:MAG: protoheme IX farnesyltransferase [Proteobacteria bacterium]|nr:protoheme IX farnesyltransferase [Pseudomonadota bacterium]
MSLVVFTAITGLLVAPGTIHPFVGFVAILCIAIGAGASGALNMWFDADIDAVMRRTRERPIPAGRMDGGVALGFGATLAVASVTIMGLATNYVAAALLAFTILFYLLVYTIWLKRRTPENIVIGGAAGALPPVVGWAAVTGGVSIEPLVLFAIIFLWTPPHFWALALFYESDYEKAGIPMLPVVVGEKKTRLRILAYSFALVPVGLLPWVMGFAGPLYALAAATCGGVFLYRAVRLYRTTLEADARRLFSFSIIYLFVLFAALAVEQLIGRLI